ncbi:hypothetical protein [Thiofilum flexile]|uniref:hypothetical protein n=1 Tax=Thiofilum flexile TaxID=125627 RepID=UPI0003708372|nr:hypothetical protein [Thiofilum flexile]
MSILAQDTPEALVLAILCDFKARPMQEVVNYIVKRLKELTGDNEARFRNYYEMLETLADNRDLQAQLDEAKHMLTQVDVTRFSTYRWGLQAGLEQGREQGHEQGLEQGAQLKATEMAKKLITKGLFEIADIADLTGLTVDEVQTLKDTLLH